MPCGVLDPAPVQGHAFFRRERRLATPAAPLQTKKLIRFFLARPSGRPLARKPMLFLTPQKQDVPFGVIGPPFGWEADVNSDPQK